jgi:two-component system LytT family response regulator
MKNTIPAIIIDDELRARTLLEGMLKSYLPHVNVLAMCEDVPQGVKAIKKFKPALIFLDIEMPRHSGLEILEFFNEEEVDFEIIFVTGYNQYVINALKLSAIDYLLKPLDITELEQAVERYEKKQQKQDFKLLSQNLRGNDSGKIAVPSGETIKIITVNDIRFLKADNSYTEIHLTDHSVVIASRTLKNFDEMLTGRYTFFRSHKSYLVNTLMVKEYVKSDGGYLVMDDSTTVSISPDKVEEFLSIMKFIKRA